MGSPMTPSHLTLSDAKGQSQGHSDFEGLCIITVSQGGTELPVGHILLLNPNRKPYMGNLTAPFDLTLKGQSQARIYLE